MQFIPTPMMVPIYTNCVSNCDMSNHDLGWLILSVLAVFGWIIFWMWCGVEDIMPVPASLLVAVSPIIVAAIWLILH